MVKPSSSTHKKAKIGVPMRPFYPFIFCFAFATILLSCGSSDTIPLCTTVYVPEARIIITGPTDGQAFADTHTIKCNDNACHKWQNNNLEYVCDLCCVPEKKNATCEFTVTVKANDGSLSLTKDGSVYRDECHPEKTVEMTFTVE